jgi:GTPase SAR1 family protein
MKRNIKVINLDPAAEKFFYTCDLDIRELITVEDVMNKLKRGPNGALVYCMEYLLKNISWLEERINEFGDNVYYIIDCPGQLELYSHYNVMKKITNHFKSLGMNICTVFCLDSTFLQEQSKFVSGSVLSLASMVQMELPHMTVLTKCDLIEDKSLIDNLHELDPRGLINEINPMMGKKMENLNKALINMIDSFALIDFLPLDNNDDESVNAVLYHADMILQYLENQEPREEYYQDADQALQDKEFDGDYVDYSNNYNN